MNKLENHIRSNKEGLNNQSPDLEAMWGRIEENLDPPVRKMNWATWASVAAAACIIFFIGFWTNDPQVDFVEKQQFEEPLAMAEIDPEMAEEESRLQAEFDERQIQLASYELQDKDLVFFMDELSKIDTLDVALRAKIGKVKNQKKLLQSILDNYKKRIRIVEQMIREIEKKERDEKRKKGSYA